MMVLKKLNNVIIWLNYGKYKIVKYYKKFKKWESRDNIY
jgi:hypothetical protein